MSIFNPSGQTRALTARATNESASPRRAWLALPVLALMAASTAVQAQMGGGMGGMGGQRPPGGGPPKGGESACAAAPAAGAVPTLAMVQSMVNERLNSLPAELQLDSSSQPAFDRYASAVMQLVNDEVRRSLRPPQATREVAQALQQQITDANSRLAAWEDVQQASQALTKLLGSAQREIANRRLVVSIEPKNWMTKA